MLVQEVTLMEQHMNKRLDPYAKLTKETSSRPQVDLSHEMSAAITHLIADRTKEKGTAGVLKARRQGRTAKDILREGAVAIIEAHELAMPVTGPLYDLHNFLRVAVESYLKDVSKRARAQGRPERIIVFDDIQEMKKTI